MNIQNIKNSRAGYESRISRKRKIERTIKVVSRLDHYKFDKTKFPEPPQISGSNGDEYLITIEKGKIIALKNFAEYFQAKVRFRELLEKFSLSGEVTKQFSDEFTVLTDKQ